MTIEEADKAVKLLCEFIDSRHIEYYGEDDEVGSCIHCGKFSYKPHEKDCILRKAEEFLNSLKH